MWLRLRNIEGRKDICPSLLLENPRPPSPSWGSWMSYQPAQDLTLSGLRVGLKLRAACSPVTPSGSLGPEDQSTAAAAETVPEQQPAHTPILASEEAERARCTPRSLVLEATSQKLALEALTGGWTSENNDYYFISLGDRKCTSIIKTYYIG